MKLGLGLGFNRRRRVGGGAPAFSPADLFTASEAGFWGQVRTSDLWQDVARTTPVTAAGQPVGSWRLYTSSGVTYAEQPTAGNRPTYEVDGNGRDRIQFGASRILATPTITPGTDVAQVIITMSTVGTGTQIFLEHSVNTDGNNGSLAIFQAVGDMRFRSRGTVIRDAAFPIPTPPDQYVLTGLGSISGDSAILRRDGVQVGQNLLDQGTGNYTAQPFFIGGRGDNTLNALGAFYGVIVRFGPALSGPQLANAEAWASALRNP